jgi:hypothetical protein
MDTSQWVAPVAASLAATATNRVTNSKPVKALAVVRGAALDALARNHWNPKSAVPLGGPLTLAVATYT